MLRPVYWSEQNNAGALHEERAQIAIATLSDAAEDGTITRGDLFRHQAEPRCKVARLDRVALLFACEATEHRRVRRAWA